METSIKQKLTDNITAARMFIGSVKKSKALMFAGCELADLGSAEHQLEEVNTIVMNQMCEASYLVIFEHKGDRYTAKTITDQMFVDNEACNISIVRLSDGKMLSKDGSRVWVQIGIYN